MSAIQQQAQQQAQQEAQQRKNPASGPDPVSGLIPWPPRPAQTVWSMVSMPYCSVGLPVDKTAMDRVSAEAGNPADAVDLPIRVGVVEGQPPILAPRWPQAGRRRRHPTARRPGGTVFHELQNIVPVGGGQDGIRAPRGCGEGRSDRRGWSS